MNEAKKEMFEKTFLQEQERLKQNAEKMRMKQLKEEERIMSIDTSKMPPLQVEYIQRRQMEILGEKNWFLILLFARTMLWIMSSCVCW